MADHSPKTHTKLSPQAERRNLVWHALHVRDMHLKLLADVSKTPTPGDLVSIVKTMCSDDARDVAAVLGYLQQLPAPVAYRHMSGSLAQKLPQQLCWLARAGPTHSIGSRACAVLLFLLRSRGNANFNLHITSPYPYMTVTYEIFVPTIIGLLRAPNQGPGSAVQKLKSDILDVLGVLAADGDGYAVCACGYGLFPLVAHLVDKDPSLVGPAVTCIARQCEHNYDDLKESLLKGDSLMTIVRHALRSFECQPALLQLSTAVYRVNDPELSARMDRAVSVRDWDQLAEAFRKFKVQPADTGAGNLVGLDEEAGGGGGGNVGGAASSSSAPGVVTERSAGRPRSAACKNSADDRARRIAGKASALRLVWNDPAELARAEAQNDEAFLRQVATETREEFLEAWKEVESEAAAGTLAVPRVTRSNAAAATGDKAATDPLKEAPAEGADDQA